MKIQISATQGRISLEDGEEYDFNLNKKDDKDRLAHFIKVKLGLPVA